MAPEAAEAGSDGAAPLGELRLAGIGYRAAARIVDVFVMSLLFIGVATLVVTRLGDTPRSPFLAEAILYGVAAVYEVVLTAVRGQTVGKMVLQLRVLRLPDLERPGLARSFIRYVVPALAAYVLGSVPTPLGYVTGLLTLGIFLFAIVDPRRQGLHDKAAGTIVVTERTSPLDAMMRG